MLRNNWPNTGNIYYILLIEMTISTLGNIICNLLKSVIKEQEQCGVGIFSVNVLNESHLNTTVLNLKSIKKMLCFINYNK